MMKNFFIRANAPRLSLCQSLLNRKFCSIKESSIIQITSKIIRKIADPPIIAELERQSLRDQILEIASKSSNEKWKEQIKQMYQTGIQRNEIVHNQSRFIDGQITEEKSKTQLQKKIIFQPFHLIGSQIIDQINNFKEETTLSFGHYGISKSFRYYEHQCLLNIIINQLIKQDQQKNRNEEQKQILKRQRKEKLQQIKKHDLIPIKLFYWNMSTNVKNTHQHLIKMFSSQCNQISSETLQSYGRNFQEFIQKITQFYTERGVKTCLVVDQINYIFSLYRKKLLIKNTNQFNQLLKKQKDLIQSPSINQKKLQKEFNQIQQLNNFRLYAQKYFNKVIFNSSVNVEALYEGFNHNSVSVDPVIDRSAINYIESKVHKNMLDDIELTKQWHHSKYYKKARIIYPQLLLQESVVWELTDFIVFELEKQSQIKQNLEKKVESQINGQKMQVALKQYLRNYIHPRMKQILKRTIVTPLAIRMVFKQFECERIFSSQHNLQEQFLEQVIFRLDNLQRQSSLLQMKSLDNFGQKMPNIKQKYKIIAKIYSHVSDLLRKKQQKLDQNDINNQSQILAEDQQQVELSFQQQVRQKVKNKQKQILYFLQNQQNQVGITPFYNHFDRLNQNMFISFKNIYTLKSYIKKILKIIFEEFIINQQDPSKRQILHKLQQQIRLNLISKYQNKDFPIVFILTSCQNLILSFDNQIRYIIKYEIDYLKEAFINKSVSGQIIQYYMVNAFKNEKQRVKIMQKEFDFSLRQIMIFKSFPKSQNKDKGKSEQLIKIKSASKSSAKKKQLKKAEFFNQFLKNIQAQTTLFLPENNFTIAVDFAIRTIDRPGNIIQLNYYDVTVSLSQQTIDNKLTNFLQFFKSDNERKYSVKNQSIGLPFNVQYNYFVIVSPKNFEKLLPSQFNFSTMKGLAKLKQEEFAVCDKIDNFIKQLYQQYKVQKNLKTVNSISQKKFNSIFFNLFERSTRNQSLKGYSGVNQAYKYQLKQLNLSSFADISLQNFQKLQRQHFLHLLYKEVLLFNKLSKFKIVDMCQIKFSKMNKQSIYYQAAKQIQSKSLIKKK